MDRFKYKPIRDKQMMAAAEKYADDLKKTFPSMSESELSICLNDFRCGWEMADNHPAWISVEDQLPEKDGRYLFYDEVLGPQVSAYYDGCSLVSSITHWMPLPAAPKTAKSEEVEGLFLKVGEWLHNNLPKEFKSLDEIDEFIERFKQELKDNG